ncbi:MAG: EamA family transporter [Alphaproteobacteria bacterium]|nr:EamA family transporter [Alphaproteobacteria bacterium]MBU2043253.1 EamA family transporter [Alphaproteobacteria bacterium]MBU2126004.1 EamA family transporter [Alphaproteobacteria bacterium]MBU2209230.1 EamA family transporter [Alphaproteobacteria bacterium]MBU2290952.1 EamA family transporter [Alphaproteobacteria bacterium]
MLGIGGVMICAVIWGTTWYAITLQLGTVAPLASIVWRFGLAASLLFVGCLVFRMKLRLTRAQHLAALGQGLFAFSISYSFTYASEGLVASAIVAVTFASLTFINLVLFRVAAGQKAAAASWGGAVLGLVGVAVLSGGEVLGAGFDGRAALGVGLALIATTASAFGNFFAWKGQTHGSTAIPSTAWAMAYGTGLLALYGLATGVEFTIDPDLTYVGSLLYLSVFGSVIAFGLYFTIARTIGYAMASYISALTPPIAMLVSVLFEGAQFGWSALAGLVLVLSGQALLIRAPRVST